ncbi:MAG: homocysteine S-methyltransferase family protein [Acidobacteriota bacterium]|nr:homocysteine S-methyltransferase family protein [Acidobacteriota bacterium]
MDRKREAKIEKRVKEKIIIFDGAMGTSLQKYSLTPDDFWGKDGCYEILNLSRPEIVGEVHVSFLKAGCEVIETNTFGASRLALEENGLRDKAYEINLAAARLAREVASSFSTSDRPRFVSGSMGPGKRLPSLGQIGFDELGNSYYEQAAGLIDGGVDLLQVETAQDLLQIKAALVAIFKAQKEKSKKLPVMVDVTVDSSGRMLLGTDMLTLVTALSSFPLFSVGLNCGDGPQVMVEALRILKRNSPFLISALPNAGRPALKDGKYVYNLSPDVFASELKKLIEEFGVSLAGGCCGTTPEHLKAAIREIEHFHPARRNYRFSPGCASTFRAQPFRVKPRPLIIAERTNVNGSQAFRSLLLKEDFESMAEVAREQQREGAHLTDVALATPGRDEAADWKIFMPKLNLNLEIPVMIDTTNVRALEAALKNYGGKVIINSINLEDGGHKAQEIIAVAREFGAALIALTLDENGLARTAKEKLRVASRLYELLVEENNFEPADIFFDPLTFSLATGDRDYYDAGWQTIAAIRLIKDKFTRSQTILGISNISYGLTAELRPYINSIFLSLALEAGLDAAIIHHSKIMPLPKIPEKILKLGKDLVLNRRRANYDPLAELLSEKSLLPSLSVSLRKNIRPEEVVVEAVVNGEAAQIEELIRELLKEYSPLSIINEFLLKGMDRVGELFGSQNLPLPFVLKSAETVKKALTVIKPYLPADDENRHRGRIVLATVKGDVHDIGKNLVGLILEANGFEVIDLGINQEAGKIIQAIDEFKPQAVGLSGLLVKSCWMMKDYLETMTEHGLKIPVLCGGAALERSFVGKVLKPIYQGDVYYGKDAMEALEIMKLLAERKVKNT